MIAALRDLEKWAEEVIAGLDGDIRAEYDRLLGEVKAETATDLAKIRVLADGLEAGLGAALEAAAPTVEAAAAAALQQFLAGLAPILAEAAHEM